MSGARGDNIGIRPADRTGTSFAVFRISRDENLHSESCSCLKAHIIPNRWKVELGPDLIIQWTAPSHHRLKDMFRVSTMVNGA